MIFPFVWYSHGDSEEMDIYINIWEFGGAFWCENQNKPSVIGSLSVS